MDCSTPGFPVHHHLLELARLMSTESMMPSNHLFLFLSFTSCPASGPFLMSQLFSSGGQSIGASASASVFPVNIQGWFPLGLADLISLQSKGLWSIFSTTVRRHLQHSAFFMLKLSHPYMATGKTIVLPVLTMSMQKRMIKSPLSIIALGWFSDIKLKRNIASHWISRNFTEINANLSGKMYHLFYVSKYFWKWLLRHGIQHIKIFRLTMKLYSMIKNQQKQHSWKSCVHTEAIEHSR